MTRWPRDRIKHYPGIATRYGKNLASFRAAIKLIAFRIWSPSI
jgi:transposase